MPEPLDTRLEWVIAAMLAAGVAGWVFPQQAALVAGPMALPVLAIAAAIAAVLLSRPWPVLRLCLAVLLGTAVWGWAPASETSTAHLAGLGLSALVMMGCARSGSSVARLRVITTVYLAGGAAMILAGIAGTPRTGKMLDGWLPVPLPSMELGLAGLEAGLVNPNALAAAALVVGPVALAALWFGRLDRSAPGRLLWMVGALTAALAVVTLVISNSRTAWAASGLLLAGALLRRATPRRVRTAIGVVLVAAVVVLLGVVAVLGVTPTFETTNGLLRTGHDRLDILRQGLHHWQSSPWLGIGLNEFRHVHVPNPSAAAHAHNIVLQTALDVGLIGSVAYWGMLVFLLARSRAVMESRSAGSVVRMAACGGALTLWAVTLFGLTDAVPLGAKVGLFQWFAGGLVLAASGLAGAVDAPPERGTT